MPYVVKKRGDKYRVIERDTGRIGKNKAGKALDGGGHKTRNQATKQMQAVNISEARKSGKKIPRKK